MATSIRGFFDIIPASQDPVLAPYPADEMICWPVSARVGNVNNNDPSLIEPVTAS